MKRADLFHFITNGSSSDPHARWADDLVRAGSHASRLSQQRKYMALLGTANAVLWCFAGLPMDQRLCWEDYAGLPDSQVYIGDIANAIAAHKTALPDGILCAYLPSPWTSQAVRAAVVARNRTRLRSALWAVLRHVEQADWIALDATSAWDAEHVWALHEIAAMGFQVLIEGPASRTHPHLLAFGCYVSASHLWRLDAKFATTFPPQSHVGPVIVQHDGTVPDPAAQGKPWATWAHSIPKHLARIQTPKLGIRSVHYAAGVSEPRADQAMLLKAAPPLTPPAPGVTQ